MERSTVRSSTCCSISPSKAFASSMRRNNEPSTSSVQVLLATRSSGKLRELRALFAASNVRVVELVDAGLDETAEEDALEAYDTFEENALAKARYFHARSGL